MPFCFPQLIYPPENPICNISFKAPQARHKLQDAN